MMLVRELIEHLNNLDPNSEVKLDVEGKLHHMCLPATGVSSDGARVYIEACSDEEG
jgi:hypothetical protein